jgi:hypothetical protein
MVIEISRFRLRDGCGAGEFVDVDAAFQTEFVYQQPGIVRRIVAHDLDGQWIVITNWRSKNDAEDAIRAMSTSDVAARFEAAINRMAPAYEYFKALPR